MELRHLRYFVTVASDLHFGRAAERLFISQPALSQQIRRLEGELGFKLLERTSHEVRLTPEGAAFLPEARAIVQQVDHATAVARALAEGARGHIRLSYVRTIPGGLPERIVREYRQRFPRVNLSADSGSTVRTWRACWPGRWMSPSCTRRSSTRRRWAAWTSASNRSWSPSPAPIP